MKFWSACLQSSCCFHIVLIAFNSKLLSLSEERAGKENGEEEGNLNSNVFGDWISKKCSRWQESQSQKYRVQRLSGKQTIVSSPYPYRESKGKISWERRQGRDRTLMLRQWTALKTICFYSLLTLIMPILSKSGLRPYRWGKWETAGSLVHVRAGADPLLWQRHSSDGWQEESLFLIKPSWMKKAKIKINSMPSLPHFHIQWEVADELDFGVGEEAFPDEKGHRCLGPALGRQQSPRSRWNPDSQ